MKIYRFPLTKPELIKMTDAERKFLLLAGHMQNEVVSLHKVFDGCLRTSDAESSAEKVVGGSHAMIYARILAGKLNETWECVCKTFFGSKLSRDLEERLREPTKKSLKELRAYFDRPSLIRQVRNSYAFHYQGSADGIGKNWEEAASEPGFEFLLGGSYGNTFYQASELTINLVIFEAIKPKDRPEALRIFLDDIQRVAGLFNDFLEGVMFVILEKQFGQDLSKHCTSEDIVPSLERKEIKIPYFYVEAPTEPNTASSP